MQVAEYLEGKGLGYDSLSARERDAISSFAILWTLFEAQLLNQSASPGKIIDKCRGSFNENGIDIDFLEPILDYFKGRYTCENGLGEKFEHLHFRRNDNRQLVESVLLGQDIEPSNKLACCLIIILRFRNNYFHGIKWAYQFRDQQDNFETSITLLIHCIDKYAS
jgi:hypothetical protein